MAFRSRRCRLIAIAIAGLVLGQKAAHGELLGQLRSVLGLSAAKMIEKMIANAAKPKTGVLATIVGVVTILFGALLWRTSTSTTPWPRRKA